MNNAIEENLKSIISFQQFKMLRAGVALGLQLSIVQICELSSQTKLSVDELSQYIWGKTGTSEDVP